VFSPFLPTSVELRRKYARKIDVIFKSGFSMTSVMKEESEWILETMDLPPGTAKNDALKENVFMLLVCIFNKIPVFVRYSFAFPDFMQS